jgi:hypothetical protein
MVSVTLRPRFTPDERTRGSHWIGGWESELVWTEVRRKNPLPVPGINLRLSSLLIYDMNLKVIMFLL